MFLTNTVNTQTKSLFEYNVELYEDIISFNEEYNNIKEDIILQEHSMLLEGNTLDYIQESISETAIKIWEHIKQFLIKLKNKIVEVWNIVKKKVLEIIVKLKSFFSKGEDVVVIDIKEDVSKLQRLRAYVSNIGKVTKENIIEHKKAIAIIIGVGAYLALGVHLTNKKLKEDDWVKANFNEREQELKIVTEDSPISRVADSIIREASNKSENSDDVKSQVEIISVISKEEINLANKILSKSTKIKQDKDFTIIDNKSGDVSTIKNYKDGGKSEFKKTFSDSQAKLRDDLRKQQEQQEKEFSDKLEKNKKEATQHGEDLLKSFRDRTKK
jgi:hypothetical protein